MTFAECAQAILEGKKIRLVPPSNWKVISCEGVLIYILERNKDSTSNIFSKNPNELKWEVIP